MKPSRPNRQALPVLPKLWRGRRLQSRCRPALESIFLGFGRVSACVDSQIKVWPSPGLRPPRLVELCLPCLSCALSVLGHCTCVDCWKPIACVFASRSLCSQVIPLRKKNKTSNVSLASLLLTAIIFAVLPPATEDVFRQKYPFPFLRFTAIRRVVPCWVRVSLLLG